MIAVQQSRINALACGHFSHSIQHVSIPFAGTRCHGTPRICNVSLERKNLLSINLMLGSCCRHANLKMEQTHHCHPLSRHIATLFSVADYNGTPSGLTGLPSYTPHNAADALLPFSSLPLCFLDFLPKATALPAI